MTKSQIDQLGLEARQTYFEQDYPYVFPENEVMDVIDAGMMHTFSPLENAYVRWMMETSNGTLAVDKFIHPAYWFDKENFGAKVLGSRDYLKAFLRKFRRECPFLKLYSGDYLAGLLHDEIQFLRSRERKERFYGPDADPAKFLGKKSPHEQEMAEIDRLLECLKQIHYLKIATGTLNAAPDADTGNIDNSVDRVITEAAKLIHRREGATP
jgi:hypothetical protein